MAGGKHNLVDSWRIALVQGHEEHSLSLLRGWFGILGVPQRRLSCGVTGLSLEEVSQSPLWRYMIFSQQGKIGAGSSLVLDLGEFFGVASPSEVNALCELQECARPLEHDTPVGEVTWIGLVLFFCEVRQALMHSATASSGVLRVLAVLVGHRRSVALSVFCRSYANVGV